MVIFWVFALMSATVTGLTAMLVFQTGWGWAIADAVIMVLILRGLFTYVRRSLVLREAVPDYDDMDKRTLEVNRYIFWRRTFALGVLTALYFGFLAMLGYSPLEALGFLPGLIGTIAPQLVYVIFIFFAQFAIFFGPFLLFGKMGRSTIVPGDANYDVKIEDVRGQKAAVEEMKRILELMQQGREYVKAGGKRERGVLFVGPPGTGKTMLAKGIASSLHMPIIITSGASFQGMFMGMDMVSVFMMVRAARKKAKRWGGCSIFIDEFDALGNRRSGMGGGAMPGMGGMFGGGQLGLNMLLVQMDGMDNPTWFKRLLRRFVNVSLDGLFVPREIRFNGTRLPMRVPNLRAPRYNLFFMGATNRPSVLDEAVTRPGRFGRMITFRMPTREQRKDIAELYFSKKKHDPDLDRPERRDEFARVTEGFSPAMIEQASSLALMYAFQEGRGEFTWADLKEALVNVTSGMAEPVEYSERDKLAVARHEMGHAVASHFFEPDKSPIRLSIRMRGSSLGHHLALDRDEIFINFRSAHAADLRVGLGALAAERVFYGENSSGVTGDLIQTTNRAAQMIGMWGMGPDQLDPKMSEMAANFGEYLISRIEVTAGMQEQGTMVGTTLANPSSRRAVAQIMGAAFIDAWRLMFVNQEAIDEASESLMARGELIGDEIAVLLESVRLRAPGPDDPYPERIDLVPAPDRDRERAEAREKTA